MAYSLIGPPAVARREGADELSLSILLSRRFLRIDSLFFPKFQQIVLGAHLVLRMTARFFENIFAPKMGKIDQA